MEGYGRRNYKPEFLRYLTFALTECNETILHLEFLFETESLKHELTYKELFEEYQQLSKMLNAFFQWVEKNWLTRPKAVKISCRLQVASFPHQYQQHATRNL